MNKVLLSLSLLLFATNLKADHKDQEVKSCPTMYTYACKVLSVPSSDEKTKGITTNNEWLKCELVNDDHVLPEATVCENNTPVVTASTLATVSASATASATTSATASVTATTTASPNVPAVTVDTPVCSYDQATKLISCSKSNKATPFLVIGAGIGYGLDFKTLLDTNGKTKIYEYLPQMTIGMRIPFESGASLDFGACYNVGTKTSAGISKRSSFGLYILDDNSLSLSAMFGKDQNKKLCFTSAEIAIKFPFQVQRVYFAPKIYMDYFKTYCINADEGNKKDGFVVGIGLDINVAVLGSLAKKAHTPGGCKAGWYRQIAKHGRKDW
ncbi:MAG: hypothetical protein WCQ53_03625 [bacterium]